MAEVAADLDWGLRETSREAPVSPGLRVNRSQTGGDDQELPGQGDSQCLYHEEGRGQKVPGPVSIIPAAPVAAKLSPKSKQLVCTSQPVVSAQ